MHEKFRKIVGEQEADHKAAFEEYNRRETERLNTAVDKFDVQFREFLGQVFHKLPGSYDRAYQILRDMDPYGGENDSNKEPEGLLGGEDQRVDEEQRFDDEQRLDEGMATLERNKRARSPSDAGSEASASKALKTTSIGGALTRPGFHAAKYTPPQSSRSYQGHLDYYQGGHSKPGFGINHVQHAKFALPGLDGGKTATPKSALKKTSGQMGSSEKSVRFSDLSTTR